MRLDDAPKIQTVPLRSDSTWGDKLRALAIENGFIPATVCVTCVRAQSCEDNLCPCVCHGGPGFIDHPNHLPAAFYEDLRKHYRDAVPIEENVTQFRLTTSRAYVEPVPSPAPKQEDAT